MQWQQLVFIVGVAVATHTKGEDKCGESDMPFFRIPGNVSITGILNIHQGEHCNDGVSSGLEQAAAAIWTVSVLNQHGYLPGLQIGLSLFDGCSDIGQLKKSLLQSLVYEGCVKPDTTTLGTFTTHDIAKNLENLVSSLNQTMPMTIETIAPVLDTPSLLTMAAELLLEMSFTTVHRVIADSQDMLNDFGRTMSVEGICVYDEALIGDLHAGSNEVLQPPSNIEDQFVASGPPVIFVIASSTKIQTFFENLSQEISKINDIVWLVAPTDSSIEIDNGILPNRTYILSAVIPKKEDLVNLLKNPELVADPLNHRHPSKSPIFLTIALKIMEILAPLKEIQNKSCNDVNETCSEVFGFLENVTAVKMSTEVDSPSPLSEKDIKNILTAVRIPVDDEMFLFSVTEKSKTEDVGVFQFYDPTKQKIEPTLLIIKTRRRRSVIAAVRKEDLERKVELNRSSLSTTEATIDSKNDQNVSSCHEPGCAIAAPTAEVANITIADPCLQTSGIVPSGCGSATGGTNIAEVTAKTLTDKHPCHEVLGNLSSSCGICFNFVKYLSKVAQTEKQTEDDMIEILWRSDTWVGINASVAAIGVLCSVAIFAFVMTRICVGDVLENSPALSFFMLIAIIISYVAILPFSFQSSGTQGDLTLSAVICDFRMAGPPLCYSIIFSILFSRSLMLAASGQDDGFMSHVNGYLQAVIIFFTCAVQFAISGEYWIMNSFLLNPSVSCNSMYDSHMFIILLSYDMFLLLLLLSVIPFIVRSKRNYSEGVSFSVSILVIFLLWATWIPLFYLLPSSHRDATVMLGLTGTATTVLVCIFIPRTYLMTTAIVRDRIIHTLPPLGSSDYQIASTHSLYDTLNLSGKIGTTNPNFYAVNPTDSGPGTPQIRPGEYYSSNAVPTLKLNSTRRGRAPTSPGRAPSPYRDFDSPQPHTPGHVTRF